MPIERKNHTHWQKKVQGAVQKLCDNCRSANIRLTAWLTWDIEDQRWKLSPEGGEHDSFFCLDCEAETYHPYEREVDNG